MAAILSQNSSTGFYKAPVSKGILGCMFLTSCALNVPLLAHIKQYVVYNIHNIFHKYEIWRVVSSKLTFLETKDLVCGCLLIYYFRIFERRYGSHKFSSYLMAACTVSTLLELIFVFFLNKFDAQITYLPTGPYSLIFPLFANYFMDIPRVAQTYILGIPVTGKTLTYLVGLQIMSSNKESMISGFCSLLAGVICRNNFLHVLDVIKVPKFIAKFFSVCLGWILDSSPPSDNSVPMGATLEIQRQQQLEMMEQQLLLSRARETRDRGNTGRPHNRQQMAQGYAERLVPPNNEGGLFGSFHNQNIWNNAFNPTSLLRRNSQPDEDDPADTEMANGINQNHIDASSPVQEDQVKTLVEMGFERENVIRALQLSNNDLNMATVILLNES
ncbi:ubiquitin-associated domain-containing protein 2 [Parasteatoda tepidariorum]|uniref:ubiquitin-associated domain-containing protein 2 n=1 Tax=Parasteatoda tepidariorum TaxID=114398 RepID=UPI00077FB139|nr:ubiquitin-associated domain-containing protein 2 [Parasteatoda tepidariorum]